MFCPWPTQGMQASTLSWKIFQEPAWRIPGIGSSCESAGQVSARAHYRPHSLGRGPSAGVCALQAPLTVCAVWQKAEMDNVKTKTKKANADRGNEKKTMKDKVLEKEFKLVSSPLIWHCTCFDVEVAQQAQAWS